MLENNEATSPCREMMASNHDLEGTKTMATRDDLTAEYVRQILHYDPVSGLFTWKPRTPDMFMDTKQSAVWKCMRWNAKSSGKVTGTITGRGQLIIRISGNNYLAHRLAWLYTTGAWPKDAIDHRDCNPSNNSFDNLREATGSQNGANKKLQKNNTSGLKGASWFKPAKRWMAQTKLNGKKIHIGYFSTREEAHRAYVSYMEENFGEFARAS